MKFTKTEKFMLTLHLVRWPESKDEWKAWAISEGAQAMIDAQTGRRSKIAKDLVERVLREAQTC